MESANESGLTPARVSPHIEEVLDIPQHLTTHHRREVNLLWYGPSRVFALRQAPNRRQDPGEEDAGVVGAVRIAMRERTPAKHGLICDLNVEDGAGNECATALITRAEEELKTSGATKIDAIVLDGKNLTAPFQKLGYWPQRKTVVIAWDLHELKPSRPLEGIDYEETATPDPEEVADFILASYQPYWRWWKNDLFDRPWERIDYPAQEPDSVERRNLEQNRGTIVGMLERFNTDIPQRMVLARKGGKIIGLCDAKVEDPHVGAVSRRRPRNDDHFDWGVLLRRDHPGGGFGKSLLMPMLQWLRRQGLSKAEITTTSGMDDFDPTVYLYVQSCGGVILGEFLNLVKRRL